MAERRGGRRGGAAEERGEVEREAQRREARRLGPARRPCGASPARHVACLGRAVSRAGTEWTLPSSASPSWSYPNTTRRSSGRDESFNPSRARVRFHGDHALLLLHARRQGSAPPHQRRRLSLSRLRHIAARRTHPWPRLRHRHRLRLHQPDVPLQPIVARRICPFTDKKTNRANKVSFSNHKTKKQQFMNLQYKKLWWEASKGFVKLCLSTKALRTIEKHGLDAVAMKTGIFLNNK